MTKAKITKINEHRAETNKEQNSDWASSNWDPLVESRKKMYFDDPTWPDWLKKLVNHVALRLDIPPWGVVLAFLSFAVTVVLTVSVVF